MKAELKKETSYNLVIALFCALSIALGVFTLFFGDVLSPVICALLSLLFTFERKEKRILSCVVSSALIIMNIAGLFLFDGFCSFFGFFAVLFGVITYLFFTRGIGKTDCVVALTSVGTVFVALAFVYFAMSFTGNYTLSAISEFVLLLRTAFEKIMSESLASMIATMPEAEEQLSEMLSRVGVIFDSLKVASLSFAVIIGFISCGISLKLYSFIVYKISDIGEKVFSWKFKTSRIFAYFYIALSLATIFMTSSASVFSVATANLYNIFMVVYAYLGFNFAVYLLSFRRSKAFSFFVIIIAILLFTTFAIEILSFMGVLYTINDRGHNGEEI